MTTGEFFIGLLGSGVGAGIMAIVLACLQRKWKKEDKHDDRLEAIMVAQKVMMVHMVRDLGKKYIHDGEIHIEDKESLQDMYNSYKALGGNGRLTTIMNEVNALKVIVDD